MHASFDCDKSYYRKAGEYFDGETPYTFVFKMINRSWFDAYEIQIELFEVTYYPAIPMGLNKRLTGMPLKQNHIKQIPARKRLTRHSLFANHCINFRTNADLCAMLANPGKALLLQITLKHGLSGLSRIYKTDYRGSCCIKPGNFCFGNTFEVK